MCLKSLVHQLTKNEAHENVSDVVHESVTRPGSASNETCGVSGNTDNFHAVLAGRS